MRGSGASDVAFYVAQSNGAPRLTREQELELALRWKLNGDRVAADRLARAHLRYVVTTALKYRRYGVPVSELIAEGNFGVVHALGRFDPKRGIRFVTYAAHWIRAYIMDHIIKTWSVVGGSMALRSRSFFRLRRDRARLLNALGDEEAAELVLAGRLGLTAEHLRYLLQRLDGRDVSLDAPASASSSASALERLVTLDDQEQRLSEHRLGRGLKSAVEHALSLLDARERFIAEQRLMVDPADALSFAELGRHLGVSRERARQLETRTKRKLRAGMLASSDASVSERIQPKDAA